MYKAKHKRGRVAPVTVGVVNGARAARVGFRGALEPAAVYEVYGNGRLVGRSADGRGLTWTDADGHGWVQSGGRARTDMDGQGWGRETATVVLSPLRPGCWMDLAVVVLSEMEAGMDLATILNRPRRTHGVRLSWSAIDLADCPDFYAYRIYQTVEASPAVPDVLAAEITGAENNSWTSAPLEEGVTYRFAMALVDWIGNESALGAVVEGEVNNSPLPVTSAQIEYDGEPGRTATLTAQAPENQAADCVGYRIYMNDDLGELEEVTLDDAVALVQADLEGVIEWTTPELTAGDWRFEIRAVDDGDLESEGAKLELALEMDGDDLVEVVVKPHIPTIEESKAVAGGKIWVRVVLAGAGDTADALEVTVDSEAAVEVATEGAQEVEWTSAALADGDHTVSVAASLEGRAGEAADTVTVTTDATAPTGDQTLTLENVD